MNDDDYRTLIVELDEAIRQAAKFGCEAEEVLLDLVLAIVDRRMAEKTAADG